MEVSVCIGIDIIRRPCSVYNIYGIGHRYHSLPVDQLHHPPTLSRWKLMATPSHTIQLIEGTLPYTSSTMSNAE